MINKIFGYLKKRSASFMEQTYLNVCNDDFRKHPDVYIKACVLADGYALQEIEISFENGSIRMTGSSMVYDFDTKTRIAPVDVCYKIIRGESAICHLISVFNELNEDKFKPYMVEDNKLIVKGNINHWVDFDELVSKDTNDIVSTVIEGGEDKLKEAALIINQKIKKYNKYLFRVAYKICLI